MTFSEILIVVILTTYVLLLYLLQYRLFQEGPFSISLIRSHICYSLCSSHLLLYPPLFSSQKTTPPHFLLPLEDHLYFVLHSLLHSITLFTVVVILVSLVRTVTTDYVLMHMSLELGSSNELEHVLFVFWESRLSHVTWSFLVPSIYVQMSWFHFSLHLKISIVYMHHIHYAFINYRHKRSFHFPVMMTRGAMNKAEQVTLE